MTLHYTAGGTPADLLKAGFNLADVSSVDRLNLLPDGMKGLVWVGTNVGATATFQSFVRQFVGNPKLFGFRLGDEPDITGKYKTRTDPAALMAESDFIHATIPGAKTFVTLMDMGPYGAPDYSNTYNYANTHIDLFGIDPYPVRPSVYDVNYIDKAVDAAVKSGIELVRIVPVFQAFGGGSWTSNTGDGYKFPSIAQMTEMFQRWDRKVPNAQFDFAYVWEVKNGHTCIGGTSAAELAMRDIYRQHNTAVVAPTSTAALTIEGQPATQAGIDALVAARNSATAARDALAAKIAAGVKALS
ncbi:hypothetical protein LB523_12130 [Mesorhizobium sp. ESP-6-4]|uniref:hypothetical protein n=1 Tax=Mesorhizobium sp. ESP-6-4 TaxID=2876624 RepID=UPI001CCFA13D|nr:hypothetical protein [Mesorhizobium sp. ESP-6-4]MBZ9659794.1 hypothetical protein [Mesorhizobium sp. ESP-6-4]